MNSQIKILHVFGRMERGGAEMRTLDLMRHMDRQRYQMQYCALSGLPGELDDEIRALGGEVHMVPLGLGFSQRFSRLLQEHHFDVVHSHVHYSSGFMLRLAARENIGVRIAHFRMTRIADRDDLRRRLQRPLLRRWINIHATDIMAVSKATMSVVWPQWERDQRCQVVYNGFDTSLFAGEPDYAGVRREFNLPMGCKLYIHVGRLSIEKNHEWLIAVFAQLLHQEPTSRLLIVGKGGNEVEKCIRTRIGELGLQNQIVLTGVRTDIPRLLKAADLLIFPSLWEGLPGAVLEACAANTPVLASDLPGVKEIASYFSSVRYLSLSKSDSEWASAAETIVREATTAGIHSETFATSPFNIDNSLQIYYKVWKGRAAQC